MIFPQSWNGSGRCVPSQRTVYVQKNSVMISPLDSIIFLSPLLIRLRLTAGLDNAYVDLSVQLIYLNLKLDMAFNVVYQIICCCWGPRATKCLRAHTVSVTPLGDITFGFIEGVESIFEAAKWLVLNRTVSFVDPCNPCDTISSLPSDEFPSESFNE